MKPLWLDAASPLHLCIGITRDLALGAQMVGRMQGISAEHGWKL